MQSVGEATKSVVFFRLVTKSREQIAAFDGVGGVLGHLEQFGEFRPVGAAGEEGVDKRSRDYAETLQALLFLEGLVVSGLLFCEVGVALFESGEENGVFLARGPWRLSLCGGKLLVSPVQRLIAELVGLVLPLKRLGVELLGLLSYDRRSRSLRKRRVKSIDVRLINGDRPLTVDDTSDDDVRVAFVLV